MPFAFQVTESAQLRNAVAALGLRLLAASADATPHPDAVLLDGELF